jgi:large repetitive protein
VTDEVGQSAAAAKSVPVGGAPSTPAPTADFVFSPVAPNVGQAVSFNASQSKAAAGHIIVSYSWNFGDGGTGTDVTPSHTFGTAGTYSVVLIVTDDVGQTGTTSKPVPVSPTGQTVPPTASFVFSPTSPATNQDVFFNASSSVAAAGRSITTYAWDFGDGSPAPGNTSAPTHPYSRPGTFTVTLTVTDNSSPPQTGVTTRTVNVSSASGQIVAEFVFSPTDPAVLQTVFFDATPSIASPSATITVYDWDFGDGSSCSTNGPACTGSDKKPQHAFGSANTFVVRLTVTDSAGKKATVTHNVTTK